jgi:hypothetical protein
LSFELENLRQLKAMVKKIEIREKSREIIPFSYAVEHERKLTPEVPLVGLIQRGTKSI